jgi:hypothetical protein
MEVACVSAISVVVIITTIYVRVEFVCMLLRSNRGKLLAFSGTDLHI